MARKIKSPPLSKEEIRDIKIALKQKGRIFKNAEDCIAALHKYASRKTKPKSKPKR